jgi:hypothetical protein
MQVVKMTESVDRIVTMVTVNSQARSLPERAAYEDERYLRHAPHELRISAPPPAGSAGRLRDPRPEPFCAVRPFCLRTEGGDDAGFILSWQSRTCWRDGVTTTDHVRELDINMSNANAGMVLDALTSGSSKVRRNWLQSSWEHALFRAVEADQRGRP